MAWRSSARMALWCRRAIQMALAQRRASGTPRRAKSAREHLSVLSQPEQSRSTRKKEWHPCLQTHHHFNFSTAAQKCMKWGVALMHGWASMQLLVCSSFVGSTPHTSLPTCACGGPQEYRFASSFMNVTPIPFKKGLLLHPPACSVPLEVRVEGDKDPLYEFSMQDVGRVTEAPVLPFNAYGTLAWARNEFENNSASSQRVQTEDLLIRLSGKRADVLAACNLILLVRLFQWVVPLRLGSKMHREEMPPAKDACIMLSAVFALCALMPDARHSICCAALQVFFLLKESELTPTGANLLDGRFAVFGYVTEDSDAVGYMQVRKS
eukprot:1160569-Pelagomonas_calceolata.AAC.12